MANETNTEPTYTAENLTDDDIRGAWRAGLVPGYVSNSALNGAPHHRREVADALNASLPAGARVKTPAGWEP